MAMPAAAAPAKFTDRNEYDLVLTIRAEAAPQKRLVLLDQWKAKYPKTELLQVRQELYFSAYQSLGDNVHMLSVAREMVTSGGDNLVGLYWTTLLVPESKEVSPDLLGAGEKAANQLLAGLDKYFGPAAKPAATTPEDWKKRRTEVELLAHRALGWIQWQRADYPGAEAEFAKCLEIDPTAAEISAWYGTVLALDRKPGNQAAALWHLARAASYRDAGALPEGQRRQMNGLLERLYTTYHGDDTGLDQLKDCRRRSPPSLPPISPWNRHPRRAAQAGRGIEPHQPATGSVDSHAPQAGIARGRRLLRHTQEHAAAQTEGHAAARHAYQ